MNEKKDSSVESNQQFKSKVESIFWHLFDHHSHCDPLVCDKVQNTRSKNDIKALYPSWEEVYTIFKRIIDKAAYIRGDVLTNICECINNIRLRFSGDKRLFISGRAKFDYICGLTVLRFNFGDNWMSLLYKKLFRNENEMLVKLDDLMSRKRASHRAWKKDPIASQRRYDKKLLELGITKSKDED